MSWAAGRRVLIVGILLAVAFISICLIAFFTLHKAPSCTDGIQNRDEEGVDCGGSCAYLCRASVAAPIVSFARDIRLPQGRTDVIAYVENPNASAVARAARFTIELYGVDRTVISQKSGSIDLPPRSAGAIPVYVPGFFSGSEEVAQVFLSFDEASLLWQRVSGDARLLPTIGDPTLSGEDTAPRVRVAVTNPHATTLRNVKLIVTVFDENDNAIAASQTVVAELLPSRSTEAVFTWNAPFTGDASVIDVRPVIPLAP